MTEFRYMNVGNYYPVREPTNKGDCWRIGLKVSTQHMITCPDEGLYEQYLNAHDRCVELNAKYKEKPMAKYVYVKITAESAKVWGYDSYVPLNDADGPTRVICYWGNIGRTMNQLQQSETKFRNRQEAYNHVSLKIKDKLDKGYWRVENHLYFELTEIYRDKLEMHKP